MRKQYKPTQANKTANHPRRSHKRAMLAALYLGAALILTGGSSAQAAGWLDSSFLDPNANGTLISSGALQSDGKILIAGDFSTVGGLPRTQVARLNSNGAVDSSFANPNLTVSPDSHIRQVLPQSDGKILIAGDFSQAGGQPRPGLARLSSNGTLDSSFVPPTFDGAIYKIAVQSDGKVLVVGDFYTVGGVARDQIARLNPGGPLDSSFTPPTSNGLIETLAIQPDGKILIGGSFSSLDGVQRRGIARLNPNGSLDSSFNALSVSRSVSTLTLTADGKILAGGRTSTVYRLQADGSADSTFRSGICTGQFSAPCFAAYNIVMQPDGKILVMDDGTKKGFLRLNADGDLDLTFNPKNNGAVWWAATQPDGKIIVGGQFAQMGGGARNNLARLVKSGSAPAAPTGASASEPDATSMKVSWNPVPGDVTEYRVFASPGEQSCWARATENSCYMHDLVEGTTYTFKVIAYNDFGPSPESLPSAPMKAERQSIQPPPPPNVDFRVTTSSKVSRKTVTLSSRANITIPTASDPAYSEERPEPISITQVATTGGKKKVTRCRAQSQIDPKWMPSVDGEGREYVGRITCRLGKKGRKALKKAGLNLTLTSTLELAGGSKVAAQKLIKLKRKR